MRCRGSPSFVSPSAFWTVRSHGVLPPPPILAFNFWLEVGLALPILARDISIAAVSQSRPDLTLMNSQIRNSAQLESLDCCVWESAAITCVIHSMPVKFYCCIQVRMFHTFVYTGAMLCFLCFILVVLLRRCSDFLGGFFIVGHMSYIRAAMTWDNNTSSRWRASPLPSMVAGATLCGRGYCCITLELFLTRDGFYKYTLGSTRLDSSGDLSCRFIFAMHTGWGYRPVMRRCCDMYLSDRDIKALLMLYHLRDEMRWLYGWSFDYFPFTRRILKWNIPSGLSSYILLS